ncbi:MAG: methyltransferase [Deltaproteobacteria bacterium]|nr:methyltransferase [Deltaproteobacteria bacterium]
MSTELRRIAGYPAELVEFEHRGVRLCLYQVARLEELVDRQALLREDALPEPPYWAHLWIGARALARFLVECGPLASRRVLDLGCGLGLPGLVAAALGAEVWLVDRERAALEFAAASARHNALRRVHCARIDFTRAALGREFDVILGAEVVYDPASYAPLCEFLVRHLRADGMIHLTDAFRSDAERFVAELRRRGFEGERRPRHELEEGRPQGLFLWTFRRSG